jgi:type II protein arginine methyltransferase
VGNICVLLRFFSECLTALDMSLVAAIPIPYQHFGRWAAEPLRHIMLPASCFVCNPKGFPVLSKPMQQFLRTMMKVKEIVLAFLHTDLMIVSQFRPSIILSQTDAALHHSGGPQAYLQYIKHIERTSPELIANFTLGWGDYLQAPLQVGFCIIIQANSLKHAY